MDLRKIGKMDMYTGMSAAKMLQAFFVQENEENDLSEELFITGSELAELTEFFGMELKVYINVYACF